MERIEQIEEHFGGFSLFAVIAQHQWQRACHHPLIEIPEHKPHISINQSSPDCHEKFHAAVSQIADG